MSYFKAKMHRI